MTSFWGAKLLIIFEITLFITYFLLTKKEAKKLTIIHSLAQRTNQETSTLTKASPYMERMQHRKLRRPTIFFRFGKPGHGLSFSFNQEVAETDDSDYVFFLHDSG